MSRYFPSIEECGSKTMFGSVRLRTYAGDKMQLSLADIPDGSEIEWHSHPNEQIGMVISGQLQFEIGDEVRVLGPQEFFFIPGGVRHRVIPVGGSALALDIFYPIREEYR